MKNADSPATAIQFDHIDHSGNRVIGQWRGLTKREYFASMAMQGLTSADTNDELTWRDIAAHSVEAADALLKALEDK